jgi:hypothetical protein
MVLSLSFVHHKRLVSSSRELATNLISSFQIVSDYVCRSTVGFIATLHLMHGTDPEHRYEYLWEDGVKFKRPTKLPAPEYVDALMNWAQNLLDDENVFPNKIGLSALGYAGRDHTHQIVKVYLSPRTSVIRCARSSAGYFVYMRIYTAITLITYVLWA